MSAVVTGLGVTAPTGLGTADHWEATLHGRGAIGPVRRFDASGYTATLAGEVPGFKPGDHLPSRLIPQTDQVTRLALTAGAFALSDAGIDPSQLSEYDMGVVTASASGGFEYGHRELENLWALGPEHVSAYQSFAWFYAVNTGQLSIRYGMRGPGSVLVSEQAGGLDAIGQARRSIRKGVPLMVTGGMDASLCPWGWAMQLKSGLLSTRDDASRAYLPFDKDACGYVPGEGGAILVVEDAGAARERGAPRIYGEIAGYAATFDPSPRSDRGPGLGRAARLAIADAGLGANDIDVVFADAAGVPGLDRIEAATITRLFGPGGVPVTAPKTMTGRLYSGGAALDVVTALLSIRDHVIPPTINVARQVPGDDLDLVIREPRRAAVRTVLVLARGHGGFNAAMVIRDIDSHPSQPMKETPDE